MAGAALAGGRPVALPAPTLPITVALAVALVGFSFAGTDLAVFWALGLGMGFVLQRSRFCFAGAFRDLIMAGDGRLMRALIVGMAVATGGFFLLMARLVPDPSIGDLPTGAHVAPVGLHLVVGGLLFGVGMVIAGGCVSGTLFRIGEGYVQSIVALIGILAGLSIAAHTWNWWWQVHIGAMPMLWLPRLLGHGGGLALALALLGGLYLAVLWWETRVGPPLAPAVPAPPAFSFGERLTAFRDRVLRHGWPALAGGLALGVLNIFSFTYEHPLGVTGELSAWAERISGLAGLAAGPLLGVDQFAGCGLALGDAGLLTSTFTLDLGLIVGSFAAAQASSEFRLRFPRRRSRYVQALGGGALMGYGAGLAIGCTIGAFFSAIPSLAVSGWLFGLSLAGGAFLGTLLVRRLP